MTGKRIVVIGAGYAGLAAANRAGRKNRVTLIAPEDRMLHRVRQHETAAGRPEHRPTIAELTRGRQVTHLQHRVTELDLTGRKIFLDSGDVVEYDTLVYALGSRTAFHGVPGAAEHSYPVERAAELNRRIQQAAEPGTIAVVGGGPTGIELGAELAEAHPAWQVRSVAAEQVGGWLSAKGHAHILQTFERLGVQVDEYTRVTSVAPDGLDTDRGFIKADLIAWAGSFEPQPLAAEAGLAVTPDGQAIVDEYLRSVSHPEVYVIGDAAAVTVPGIGKLRMACATAQPMGHYLGDVLSGRTPKPFTYKYVAQCLSLGRRDGLLQLIHGDDSMRPTVLTGTAGRLAKAAIVSGIVLGVR